MDESVLTSLEQVLAKDSLRLSSLETIVILCIYFRLKRTLRNGINIYAQGS